MTTDQQTFVDNGYTITLSEPAALLGRREVVQEWHERALASDNLYAFYQSPLWWQYTLHNNLNDYVLRLKDAQQATMLEIRDDAGRLVCLAGLYRDEYGLCFRYKERVLCKKQIPVVRVAGGAPLLLKQQAGLLVLFAKAALAAFSDCTAVHIPWLPTESTLFASLQSLHAVTPYLPCREYATHFSISLYPTFDAYLARLSHKTRYQVKKAVKKLREQCANQMEMVRVEQAEQVQFFLDAATAVSGNSWQYAALGPQMENSSEEVERYSTFARQGLLRCYLLRCKGEPVAFVRGFQFGGVYYYSRTGFDAAFHAYAPGKVLLYLVLEDLHTYNSPRSFNFQEGDYEYKRHFATDCFPKADFLLVRTDWRRGTSINKLAIGLHSVYQRSVVWLKKLVKSDTLGT